MSARWTLAGDADVGGFGVGSEFSYQLYAGAEYQFSKTFTGKIGYRQLRTDYENASKWGQCNFARPRIVRYLNHIYRRTSA